MTDGPPAPRRGARAVDGREVVAALVVAAGWAALRHGFPSSMDVTLADETNYHAAAWQLLHRGALSLSPEASPLYVAWCALWQLLCRGDVALAYFAQWLATDLVLALVVLAVLRAAGVPRASAAAGALFWSSLGVVAAGWPRVHFLALLVALGGVLAESAGRRHALPAALAIATLVRPEYALPLVAVVTARVVGLRVPRWRIPAAGLAVGAVLLAAVLGSPRLWLAFSQHYALVAAAEHPGTIGDYWREHERVTAAAFPGARTVAAAMHVAPHEMGGFLAANAGRLPLVIVDALFPGASRGSASLATVILLAVLALGFVHVRGPSRPDPRVVSSLAVCCLVLLPSVLVFPKAVYSLPALVACAAALASGANRVLLAARWPVAGSARRLLLAAGALVLLVLCWRGSPTPGPRPVLETIARLRALHASLGRPAWRLLENDRGWCVFVGADRCETVLLDDQAEAPLRPTLEAARPDAVLVDRAWLSRRVVAGDPAFARFLQAPEEFGFRRALVSRENVVYLKLE